MWRVTETRTLPDGRTITRSQWGCFGQLFWSVLLLLFLVAGIATGPVIVKVMCLATLLFIVGAITTGVRQGLKAQKHHKLPAPSPPRPRTTVTGRPYPPGGFPPRVMPPPPPPPRESPAGSQRWAPGLMPPSERYGFTINPEEPPKP